ncbi:MAG: glycosyltransferase family 1 protein [Candidatus Promineofilum sp.]|nr:glycosyltransferase family 1 protein [Promineifilum sp.]
MPRLKSVNGMQIALLMLNGPHSGFVAPISDGFQKHSCHVRCLGPTDRWNFDDCEYLLMYGPMHSIGWAISRLRKTGNVPPIVFWVTEQLPNPSQSFRKTRLAAQGRFIIENCANELPARIRQLKQLQRFTGRAGRYRVIGELLAIQRLFTLRLVCVFSETNRRTLSNLGLPVVQIPMGYHSSFGVDLNLDRDIDVVFLGSTIDSRRHKLMGDLETELKSRRIRLVIKDGSKERGSIHGDDRTHLLNRSKIMLNIMRQPWDDLVFRELLAAPNRAMVISESLTPTALGPFLPNIHFAMAYPEELPDTITHYLKHEDERRIITDNAHEEVTQKLTMERMAGLILDRLKLSDN